MNKEQLAAVLRAVDTLDHAARARGHESCTRTKRLHRAAKTRLVNMLKDIAVMHVIDESAKLTDEERAALREVIQQINGGVASPTLQITPRRPLEDDNPDGLQESDQDFVYNNLDAAVLLLESAARKKDE